MAVMAYRRVQWLIVARPGDGKHEMEVDRLDDEPEQKTRGRRFGEIPRAVENHPGGPESGILSHPYRRYGSPYPGAYQPIPPDSPVISATFSGDLSSLEECIDDEPYSVHKEDASQDDSCVPSWELVRHSDELPHYYSRMTQAGFHYIVSADCLANHWAHTDQGDESLQRYKESLGLGGGGKDLSDPNDPRVCIIYSLAMHSEGREPVIIDLSEPGSENTLKNKPFKIKEGSKFTMTAKFKVQHEILSGLHYVQAIKRKGVRVPGGKTSEMIVSNPAVLTVCGQDADGFNRAASLPTPRRPLSTRRSVRPPKRFVLVKLLQVCQANLENQSPRRRPPAACLPAAITRPTRASSMTTRRHISSSSGASTSPRTGKHHTNACSSAPCHDGQLRSFWAAGLPSLLERQRTTSPIHPTLFSPLPRHHHRTTT